MTNVPLTTSFRAPDVCSEYFFAQWDPELGSSKSALDTIYAWNPQSRLIAKPTVEQCFPTEVIDSGSAAGAATQHVWSSQGPNHEDRIVPTIALAPFSCMEGWKPVYSVLERGSASMTACCPS